MAHFVTSSHVSVIVGLVDVGSVPAVARTCTSIKVTVASVSWQMASVAACFPRTTAGLAECLTSSRVIYGDGCDGPDPALHVGLSCVGVVRGMSESDNWIEIFGHYFLLGFLRSVFEIEVLQEGCRI